MTTPTTAANALGLPDRRHFLSTFAAAGALALPALPSLASKTGPIEALYVEHLRLEAACDAASIAVMEAEEHYEEPARPRWHPFTSEGGYKVIPTGDRKGITVLDDGDENVAYLKGLIAKEHEPDVCYQRAAHARGAKKTLAEIETWRAEVRRRKDAARLTELEAAEGSARTASAANCEAIFAIEACAIRELAFQAAILDVDWDQARAEQVLQRLVDLTGITPFGRA